MQVVLYKSAGALMEKNVKIPELGMDRMQIQKYNILDNLYLYS